MTKAQKREQDEAKEQLRKLLKPGDTLYTSVEHVSRSGMSREIKLYTIQDGEPVWLVGYAAKALEERIGKRDGIVMGGCGMDMGFALVYNLSHALYPEGFGCIGEKCPSNDHSNGDRDRTPHDDHDVPVCKDNPESCKGFKHWHRSGGYALKQRWL